MLNTFRESKLSFMVIAFFILLAVSSIAFSVYLLYFGAYNAYTYAVAILFFALAIISAFFNIFTAYSYYRSTSYDRYFAELSRSIAPIRTFPNVAIVMPVFNEDTGLVKRNMSRLKALNYPKDRLHFYLLDDSTQQNVRDDLRRFAESNSITYVFRPNRKGFKAGALNNFLKKSREDFVAIFDYDEYLTNRNFLLDTLPYFKDKSMAYVQTEKRYFKGTFFSDAVDLFDAFFFKFIQPSRSRNNTAVFAGSCGIIRKSAIDKIGGFPEYIIEDTFFSFESDMHDFKSLYMPKVYAYGKPMKTFTELVKQQWRYNYGDTQFLMYFVNRTRDKNTKKQSVMSVIDYITHGFGLNYISTVLILFTIMSALVVFVAKTPQHLSIPLLLNSSYITTTIEILGISAFAASILAPILLTKIHFKSVRKGFMVLLLNFSLSFVRARAAISAATNANPSPGWTKAGNEMKGSRAMGTLRGTLSETAFSSILLILGVLAFVINNVFGAIWLVWYSLLYLSAFIFLYKYG